MSVSPRELNDYVPCELDGKVASAILGGAVTFADIAAAVGLDARRVAEHMEDPVVAAWIGREISGHIEARLFMVTAALFAKAVGTGRDSVAAARLLLERFGQLVHRSEQVSHKGMDLQRLSDEEVAEQLKTLKEQTVVESERA